MNFKNWFEKEHPWIEVVTANNAQISTMVGNGQETEYDQYSPSITDIQHAINVSNRIKGFFPMLRKNVKAGVIRTIFQNLLESGVLQGTPFNYQNRNTFLHDGVLASIANSIGLDAAHAAVYVSELRYDFIDLFNKWNDKLTGQDTSLNHPSFPGLNFN